MNARLFGLVGAATLAVSSIVSVLGVSTPALACNGKDGSTFSKNFVGEFRHGGESRCWSWGDEDTVYVGDLTPDRKTFKEAQQDLQPLLQKDIAKYGKSKLRLVDRNKDGLTDQYFGWTGDDPTFATRNPGKRNFNFAVTVGSQELNMFLGGVGSGY